MKKLMLAVAAVAAVLGVCAADLPANYIRLNWVEATGTQAVITDYTPMNTDSVAARLMFTTVDEASTVFDAREPEGQHRYGLLWSATSKAMRMDWNAVNASLSSALSSRVVYDLTADFANRSLTIGGITKKETTKTLTEEKLQRTLRLFASQELDKAEGQLATFAKMRLYSFTLKDKGGVVKLDLLPCQTDDGRVGLWDTVAGEFHESAVANQPLLAGPRFASVTLTAYDAATGVASLAFTGVNREMQLLARAGDAAKVVAKVASGTTALDVAVPQFEGAAPGAVRFVLIDFVPVTKIKGFGSHTINTGIVPDATTTVRFKAAPDSSDSYVSRTEFGVAGAYFAFVNKAGTATGNIFWNFFGKSQASGAQSASYRNGKMHTFEFGPDGYFVDGTRKAGPFTPGTATTDKPIILCGRNPTTGTTATDWKLDVCDFAWAEIYKGGQKVRNFRPCLKDGVGQFYDTCGGQFYANAPSLCTSCIYGFFSAGPLDIEAIDDFASGVSAPVAELLPAAEIRTVTVTSYDAATGAAELAFSAGTEKKLLYVAAADCDKGADAAKWSAFACLGEVGAATTAGSYTVPAVQRSQGVLRFFLTRYLPEDQRPPEVCEYVESTGEAYVSVETGYLPKNTDKVRVRVSFNDVEKGHSVFEARDLQATKRVGLLATAPNGTCYFRVDRKRGSASAPALEVVQKRIYDIVSDYDGKSLSVDGSEILDYSGITGINGEEESIPTNLLIFASRTINTGVPQTIARAKLYSLSISNRLGTCEMDLVPCVRDGVGALYDRVTGKFMASATATPLVAGGTGLAAELKDAESSSAAVRSIPASAISFSVKPVEWTATVTIAAGLPSGRVFLAAAKEDMGESPDDWPNVVELGTVTPETRTMTVALPEEWKAQKPRQFRVFLACTEAHCPYDQLLSSLTSSGNGSPTGQYIDSGIVPDGTTKIELEVSRGMEDQAEFGIANVFYMFNTGSTSTAYRFFDSVSGSGAFSYNDNKPHTLVLGPDGGYIDDKTVVAGPLTATGTTTLTMTLFARRTDASSVAKWATATITYAKIWKDGNLVRDFVPCVKDDVGYLYDRVSNDLFGNKGSGSFTLGTRRGAALLDSEVVGVSASMRFGMGLIIVVE